MLQRGLAEGDRGGPPADVEASVVARTPDACDTRLDDVGVANPRSMRHPTAMGVGPTQLRGDVTNDGVERIWEGDARMAGVEASKDEPRGRRVVTASVGGRKSPRQRASSWSPNRRGRSKRASKGRRGLRLPSQPRGRPSKRQRKSSERWCAVAAAQSLLPPAVVYGGGSPRPADVQYGAASVRAAFPSPLPLPWAGCACVSPLLTWSAATCHMDLWS